MMLALRRDAAGAWTDVTCAATAAPTYATHPCVFSVHDACSILAQVPEPPTRLQMSCLTFRIPNDDVPTIVVLRLPPSACLVAANATVLDFAADVQRCFPATIKVAVHSTFESDSESDGEETDRLTKKHRVSKDDAPKMPILSGAMRDYSLQWNVRVEASDGIRDALNKLQLPDAATTLLTSSTGEEASYVVAELPPTALSTDGVANVGILLTHPSPIHGFLTSFAPRLMQYPVGTVMWKQTLLTFNGVSEPTINGAGKTSPDLVDNIRRRHASGTFTKLILPSTTWAQVLAKYEPTFPWMRGIHGDLRQRKVMEVLPTEPVYVRLQTS
ncbi:Aste57867_25144 [Aphanomyces stellatus]|uniref:Aste57867_25144 protein n=1 Tax=Aphanomyces stellatus TaxID=120398 RepID=A0A485LUJ2_9STRA|nr:hypothetical protein As57867_025066 [Aphanomyces stellatus]VFU01773.1 Aste57867_25144 [Aphanomyces stellatus]